MTNSTVRPSPLAASLISTSSVSAPGNISKPPTRTRTLSKLENSGIPGGGAPIMRVSVSPFNAGASIVSGKESRTCVTACLINGISVRAAIGTSINPCKRKSRTATATSGRSGLAMMAISGWILRMRCVKSDPEIPGSVKSTSTTSCGRRRK